MTAPRINIKKPLITVTVSDSVATPLAVAAG
jgi:hypothetical protein